MQRQDFFNSILEMVNNLVNILLSQAILIAIFDESFARIDEEYILALIGSFFVKHDDTRWNTCPVEQVPWKSNYTSDESLVHQSLADICFLVAAE